MLISQFNFNKIKMKNILTLLIFFAIVYPTNAQYSEPFSTANKGYKLSCANDFTGMNWTLSAWDAGGTCQVADPRDPTDYFNTTAAGKLECIDLDQEVYWESPLINTTAANPVSIKMDLTWVGFDTDVMANNCLTDYIRVEYSVNGGAYVMIPNVAGGNACATVAYPYENPGTSYSGSVSINHTGVTGGSTLKIRVKVFTNANAEIVTIDNVSVPEAGVTTGCAAPLLSTVVTQVGCSNPNSGAIDLSVSAGTPGYTYLWSNGATTQDLTNKPVGTYTVTVTDAASCSATTSATISNAPAIVLTTQVLDVSCTGMTDGEIGLDVSGGVPGYTYDWSNDGPETPDNDAQDLIGVATGTYTVTVTDASGCTATKSATIAVQPIAAYNEQFNLANKGYLANYVDDFAAVDWTMSGWSPQPPALFGRDADDFFRTSGGVLVGEDFDQEICWTSPLIDLNTGTQFSVYLAWTGFDVQSDEYINVKYSINSGAYVTIPNVIGGGVGTIQYAAGLDQSGSTTITKTGLSGSTIQIQICGQFNANLESMTIDNVSVPNSKPYCPCTAPTFTSCPNSPILSNTSPGQCNSVVTYNVVATGNPTPTYTYVFTGATIGSGSGTGSGSTFLKGNTVVTVTATNACGAPTCVFTVTVEDDDIPVLVCSTLTTINLMTDAPNCNNDTNASVPVAVDNCDGNINGVGTRSDNASINAAWPLGTTTITWTFTDAANNVKTCTQNVVVTDNDAPVLDCTTLTTINYNTDAPNCNNDTDVSVPVAADNCNGNINGVGTRSDNASINAAWPLGTTTITWTFTDVANNVKTCTQNVVVTDNDAPVLDCATLNTINYNTDAPNCNNDTDASVPVAVDNCNGNINGVGTRSDNASMNAAWPLGTTTITWTFTDAANNVKTCTQNVVVTDNDAPVLDCNTLTTINYNTDAPNCNNDTDVSVPVAVDNCNGNINGVGTRSDNASMNASWPLGTTTITWTFTDAANNVKTCTQNVIVTDNDVPNLSCPNSTSFDPNPSSCTYTLTGVAYDAFNLTDNCGVYGKTNSLNGMATLNGAVLPSGPTVIVWTVTDVNGLTNTCSFTLTVNPCVTFAGTILWKGNGVDGVKDVNMTLSGDASDTEVTGVPGTYSLIANVGDSFVISPVKSINLLNGVDIADATRISQHIGGNYLTDFYRKVSADINKSSTISSVDAALIKQALLGNPAAITIFTTTGSWRFVDSDFSPPGSAPFVVPTFPSTRTYTAASGDYTAQDFYGIKIGDVLDNANPQNFTSKRIPSMVWMTRDRSLNVGETFEVEFSVQNWNNIAAFQYSFNFNPSILEFEDLEVLQSISDFNKSENFGTDNAQNGELRIIFTSTNGSDVEDDSKVFKIRFKVLQSSSKLSEVLSLSNTILNPIAYTEDLISTEIKLVFTEGSVSNSDDQDISEKVELLQNRPNPFSDFTSIGFILPNAMDARLNIYNASGRMLWLVKKSYPSGYNEEKIHLEEALAPGVYFYELTTEYGTIVKRMILIR